MSMLITLPLPPPECSPNARCHWSRKASAVKRMRTLAWGEVCIRVPFSKRQGWKRAELRVTWYMPDRRRRDPDNLLASLKGAIDGLRDAGLIADDDALIILPATVELDPSNPRVVLDIREATAPP